MIRTEQKLSNSLVQQCPICRSTAPVDFFLETNSIFYPSGRIPICNDCLNKILKERDYNWNIVDKFCQYLDIPFVPNEFEKAKELNPDNPFQNYTQIFKEEKYRKLDWSIYFKQFRNLKENSLIEQELPLIKEERLAKLKAKWGANYDDEELESLEDLYNGILSTQNVNGKVQIDQAQKMCKISVAIDSKIRSGEDFDKLLKSYKEIVILGGFTPKNLKNVSDFESIGELAKWLESRGWVNQYYDGVSKDVVDETMKNIQSANQRLYINESSVGEEITSRIESLKHIEEQEKYYQTNTTNSVDLDKYENEGYTKLMEEEEDFQVDLDSSGDSNGE